MYSVYMHTCPNNKVYIGYTKCMPEDRWKNGAGYNTQLFGRAIKKYGWENIKHEVLYETEDEEAAKAKEIELIAEYCSTDKSRGYNCTTGGDGSPNHPVSDEQRAKMSATTLRMWKNENTRKRLLEHLRKISDANIGKKMSAEAIAKRIANRCKRVCKYSTSGEYITTYSSISEAARQEGLCDSAIVGSCKGNPKRRTYGGFIWKYEGDELTAEEIAWRNERPLPGEKAVEQLTLSGELIATFCNMHEAGRQTGTNFKSISSVCHGKSKTANGFRWRFATKA